VGLYSDGRYKTGDNADKPLKLSAVHLLGAKVRHSLLVIYLLTNKKLRFNAARASAVCAIELS
jgi:hypothetical protein